MRTKFVIIGMIAAVVLFTGGQSRASLVHHWAMDGNLNDGSGSGNTGTLSSGSADYTTVAGKVGNAIYLSGGQQVSNANPANIPVSGTGAWSLTVWAQYSNTSLGHGAVVAGWRPTTEATGQMRMLINGNGSQLTFWASHADNFGGSYPAENTWHQFTITHEANATKAVSVYVNGVGSTVSIGGEDLATIASTPTVQVGGNTGWSPTQTFTGAIDDMAIWNKALSAGQVKSMINILSVNGGALADYDAGRMNSLFNAYDTGFPVNVGSLQWNKFTGGGGTAGDVTYDAGLQSYTMWLDSSSGVVGAIPEPATVGMLGAAAAAMLLRRRFRG
jgi:hypothetical protein